MFGFLGKMNPYLNKGIGYASKGLFHGRGLGTRIGRSVGMQHLGKIRMGLAGVGGAVALGGAAYGASRMYRGVRNMSPTSYAKGMFIGGGIAALGLGLGHGSARALMRQRNVRKGLQVGRGMAGFFRGMRR